MNENESVVVVDTFSIYDVYPCEIYLHYRVAKNQNGYEFSLPVQRVCTVGLPDRDMPYKLHTAHKHITYATVREANISPAMVEDVVDDSKLRQETSAMLTVYGICQVQSVPLGENPKVRQYVAPLTHQHLYNGNPSLRQDNHTAIER